MAIKLSPPLIEGSIPAFHGTVLTVPFTMNRVVSKNAIDGIAIKIKTIQSGLYILDTKASLDDITFDTICTANFKLDNKNLLKEGQYYKIQIAYINTDGITGYFSSVATVKYTSEPTVSIANLNLDAQNIHQYEYVGNYSSADRTEKVYSYSFNLYDDQLKLVETTGEKLHSIDNDSIILNEPQDSSTGESTDGSIIESPVNYTIESQDSYTLDRDLEPNKKYYIEYIITTTNGLVQSSGKYTIIQRNYLEPEHKIIPKPSLNFENGYVTINLLGETNSDDNQQEKLIGGYFKLLRSDNTNNFNSWQEMTKFALNYTQPSRWHWKDFTVQSGVIYKYAIVQYNTYGITSNKIISQPIQVDFEHAYLYDGQRQLKIKFNPMINNFKNTVLEKKIDTIGGQYPFTFRNGNVKYKEFAISGLLSCQSDEEFLFIDSSTLNHENYQVNLINENINAERNFKLTVLEWLNNGKPKLFRSATEGNYIVRLMNVSLTPNDTLGRMLHTFNATAYEIAEYNYQNLYNFNLIPIFHNTIQQDTLCFQTISITQPQIESNLNGVVMLSFDGFAIGTEVKLNDNRSIVIKQNPEIIYLNSDTVINNISITQEQLEQATFPQLTYGFYRQLFNSDFNKIKQIQTEEIYEEFFSSEDEIDILALINPEGKKEIKISTFLSIDCILNTPTDTVNHIVINNKPITITNGIYSVKNLDNISEFKISKGVNAKVSYLKQHIIFDSLQEESKQEVVTE